MPFSDMKRDAPMPAKTARIPSMAAAPTFGMEGHAQALPLNEPGSIPPTGYAARIRARRHRRRDGRRTLRGGREGDRAHQAHHRRRHQRPVTVLPALSVVREGCGVPAVADADGPPGTIVDGMARRRTQGHGVALAGPSRIVRQPSGDWATPEGSQIAQILTEAPLASA
ncbi:hypothetical protein [Burkholderia savannae]|uniref:hypothetical protein n=1 Tax=Burkholderia savannae TaxID=1637837 RepID=UPI000A8558C9|nr:hypothetical protein [Burkholderia savannae]